MQKYEVAVIPMEKILSEIETLNSSNLDTILKQKPLDSFNKEIVHYLNELSRQIIRTKNIKEYPDLLTFGFFCREENILRFKEKINPYTKINLGRGLSFHITPSNVPLNFAYSYFAGMITGNINIIRVPSKQFKQIDLFLEALEKTNNKYSESSVIHRAIFLRYDRSSSATQYFSSLCDLRIIWGGDNTIKEVQKFNTPVRSNDIVFSDRFSISIINSKEYLNSKDKEGLALKFYNDTYYFDQNACTSPHIVIWQGNKDLCSSARTAFWKYLHELTKIRYRLNDITCVDKLTNYLTFVSENKGSSLINDDSYLWRIELNHLPEEIDHYKGNSGYFFEYELKNLNEITPIINSKYQTIAYFGYSPEYLREFIITNKFIGIDRVVPIGDTSKFDMIWDGYDLHSQMTREVVIK